MRPCFLCDFLDPANGLARRSFRLFVYPKPQSSALPVSNADQRGPRRPAAARELARTMRNRPCSWQTFPLHPLQAGSVKSRKTQDASEYLIAYIIIYTATETKLPPHCCAAAACPNLRELVIRAAKWNWGSQETFPAAEGNVSLEFGSDPAPLGGTCLDSSGNKEGGRKRERERDRERNRNRSIITVPAGQNCRRARRSNEFCVCSPSGPHELQAGLAGAPYALHNACILATQLFVASPRQRHVCEHFLCSASAFGEKCTY